MSCARGFPPVHITEDTHCPFCDDDGRDQPNACPQPPSGRTLRTSIDGTGKRFPRTGGTVRTTRNSWPGAALGGRRLIVAVALLLSLTSSLLLAACGGGGEEEPAAATTPAGETSTQAPTVERPTPTPEGRTPAAAVSPTATVRMDKLVTYEEVDEALGEFTTGGPCGPLSCQYDTESGTYLRIEPGSPEDLKAGAELQGVGGRPPPGILGGTPPGALDELLQGVVGEPVPGIGDKAAWFGGAVGVLSLRQGDIYFRIILNLPEVDSSAQLEIAKGLATKAVERLP